MMLGLELTFALAVSALAKIMQNDFGPAIVVALVLPALAKITGDILTKVLAQRLNKEKHSKMEIKSASGKKIVINLNEKMSSEEADKVIIRLQEFTHEPNGNSSQNS